MLDLGLTWFCSLYYAWLVAHLGKKQPFKKAFKRLLGRFSYANLTLALELSF